MHKILIQHKDYDPSAEVDVNKVVSILKNGKTVFIKPFLKGRDRDKGLPSDNTYIAQ